ncbi:MAG TPA: DNA repair protein RecN [Bacteroidales bacterium]|nr:DNA repair protein RecN [Bacteroidales bacterium]HRR93686.1 DNA repair protein RecN [Bacteroidales bacterium]
MLVNLYVRNYVFIRELDIGFNKGLTVITGETGAGKSILLGALSLILGARADTSVLLNGNEKCIVEGTFDVEDYNLEEFFERNDLEYNKTCILRREINPGGKSRAFINDTPAGLNILRELGEKLIDIHSQHENLMLGENIFQINVIDSYAGNFDLRNSFRKIYVTYRKKEKEYRELRENSDKNKSDFDYYSFQLNQLLEAKILPGEQDELEREQALLENAGEIKSLLGRTTGILSADESSVIPMLVAARQLMGRLKEFIPEAQELYERIESCRIELDDINSEAERFLSGVEDDPGKLQNINERLDLLYSLIQKHRVTKADELIEKTAELQRIVNSIATGDEKIAELEKELRGLEKELGDLAAKLSERRNKSVSGMEKIVTGMLRQLGMPNARFRIDLTREKDFTQTGYDRAEFMFSANREVPPENLSKVASGGELSRVMLSLKSLLSSSANLPTIIFDEIDSGVSGEVADKVGRILEEMGKVMQVINITHLPQVAARGRKHLHVYKEYQGESTITRIRLLTEEERVMEVAKLLSGSEVTPTAVENARELLNAALKQQ